MADVTPLPSFAGTHWASYSYSDPVVILHDSFGDILTGLNAVDKTQAPCFLALLCFTNALDTTGITATLDGKAMDLRFINGGQNVSDGTGFTIVAAMLSYDAGTTFSTGDLRLTVSPGGFAFLGIMIAEPFIFTHVDPVGNAGFGPGGANFAAFNDPSSTSPGPSSVGPVPGRIGAIAATAWMSYGNGIGFPPTITQPNDFTELVHNSIADAVFGMGAITSDAPYDATTSGAHGFYAGSTAVVVQLLPFFDSVVPHIFSTQWAQDLSLETGSASGHVITQTFANGTSASPAANLSIIGAFHGEVTGTVSASDVTATYGGLPCQVQLVNESVSPGRFMCVVQCIPDVSDTFTGSDFVLTFAPATGSLFYYHAWAGLSSNVDPTTTLADWQFSNSGAILNPYSQTIPVVPSGAGDMLVSSMLVDEVTQQPLVLSPPMSARLGIATQNWGAANAVQPIAASTPVTWHAAGLISQQAAYGFSTNIKVLAPKVAVPDLTGLSQTDAVAALNAVGLVGGAVTYLNSPTIPNGLVMLQAQAPGSMVSIGSSVDYTLSLGPATFAVPFVVGDTNAAASAAILGAGLVVGSIVQVYNQFVPVGNVLSQSPVGGTIVPVNYPVNLVESAGPAPPLPIIAPFDVDSTVISQYAQSPTLLALVEAVAESLDPRTNLENFYNLIWNVDTAQGFGLDIWGHIVNVSRLLTIPGTSDVFGFYTTDVPFDWQPWSQAPFAAGTSASSTYLLPDDAFRVLILTKALANIAATTAPGLNRLLQNLFPGRGVCYVLDNGGMSMSFVFNFPLTQIEFAILTQSGALPHPAGVFFDVRTIGGGDTFGFSEALPGIETFGSGTFYNPP